LIRIEIIISKENNNIVFCLLNSAKKHDIYIHSLHTIRSTILEDILEAIIGLTLVNRNPIDYSISPNYLGFFPSILPLKLECMLITPNLPSNVENWFELSGLVKMSAGCFLVRMCSVLTNPFYTFSRTT